MLKISTNKTRFSYKARKSSNNRLNPQYHNILYPVPSPYKITDLKPIFLRKNVSPYKYRRTFLSKNNFNRLNSAGNKREIINDLNSKITTNKYYLGKKPVPTLPRMKTGNKPNRIFSANQITKKVFEFKKKIRLISEDIKCVPRIHYGIKEIKNNIFFNKMINSNIIDLNINNKKIRENKNINLNEDKLIKYKFEEKIKIDKDRNVRHKKRINSSILKKDKYIINEDKKIINRDNEEKIIEKKYKIKRKKDEIIEDKEINNNDKIKRENEDNIKEDVKIINEDKSKKIKKSFDEGIVLCSG